MRRRELLKLLLAGSAGALLVPFVPAPTPAITIARTGEGFASLVDAIAAARTGDTLVVNRDIEFTGTIYVDRHIRIAGVGKRIKNSVARV